MEGSLRKVQFLSIDLETTGLNQKKDEIIAIGAVPIIGTRILAGESYYRLLRPEKFKHESMKFHGLDPARLKTAHDFSEIAEEVADLLRGKVLVGYAIELDYGFLKRALKREGYKVENKRIDVIDFEKAVCYILGERPVGEMTLDNLAKKYRVEVSYRHNALADAFITAQIFQVQLLKILKYGIKTIDMLFDLIKRVERDRQYHIF
ncbi:exonuclease domain-containing protein [Archaeoglobus fulgidus]|jgi:DNA polymerase-3 subunit epsilon|uniref:DNA polymerase III, subunit epsilon (DnaQ) n=4 Tax=Archaeoglobus TaxID=2233 RepID=O29290_ARCFU|nr:exonuclease domain-containing protein [Archaeoglobus fulgidus]AAB90271.1 DNA polymerase III, subunit epsilon (dnaQ) [Archaeoglobus fulgidus DSM 4304]AIG97845.1 exonuclease, DNA polymerase III, epsilon subunit family [Archaeoglobus fulgidus DSM 8774]KUJ93153.1 MAG: DNA polymerase III, subunit epsilon (DnaQ) [Archaeoglobus fulgidus]KUK06795.1 MAG: DNA polymerase III, subunit epsilon (DnaQ) [Archaeoglobus fulgidus]